MDYSTPWQIGFQFPATSSMLGIIELHNHICFFIVFILVFTFYMLIFILLENSIESINDKYIFLKVKKLYNVRIAHNVSLETLWIIFPTILLLFIAIPSFALLYGMEVTRESLISLKVIGHQWYWSYELAPQNISNNPLGSLINTKRMLHSIDLQFDSFMLYDNEITNKGLRLLETTNPLVLPVKTNIRILVTSSDVLHSWAIPSFGVKIDACPGRLNQIILYIDRIGHFYGQCSELCGVNHGFMPIEVYAVSKTDFISYLYYTANDNSILLAVDTPVMGDYPLPLNYVTKALLGIDTIYVEKLKYLCKNFNFVNIKWTENINNGIKIESFIVKKKAVLDWSAICPSMFKHYDADSIIKKIINK